MYAAAATVVASVRTGSDSRDPAATDTTAASISTVGTSYPASAYHPRRVEGRDRNPCAAASSSPPKYAHHSAADAARPHKVPITNGPSTGNDVAASATLTSDSPSTMITISPCRSAKCSTPMSNAPVVRDTSAGTYCPATAASQNGHATETNPAARISPAASRFHRPIVSIAPKVADPRSRNPPR